MEFGGGDKGLRSSASEDDAEGALDANSGHIAFATLLALHRIAVEPAQLRHDLGHQGNVTSRDLLPLVKREESVSGRSVIASWDGLASLPALANGPHGWFLIGKTIANMPLSNVRVAPLCRLLVPRPCSSRRCRSIRQRCCIRLNRAEIDRGDRVVPLTPGMAVTADIRTGERSIMSCLISPIDEARQEAGRER